MGKIIFYAPVGNNVPDYLIGGGEMGCRRTRHILEDEAGHKVITIDKAILGLGAANYIKMIIQSFARITALLLKNRDALLYVVGFYEKNLWYEWLLISIGKLLGHKTVYEARNGRLVKAYYEYGKIYKFFMRSTLKKASRIICQGQEYVDFIQNKLGKQSIYMPNYILDSKKVESNPKRMFDTWNLVYFGRITESKNVDVIIEILANLEKKGVKTKLYLIGGYTAEYRKKLDTLICESGVSKMQIVFTGAKPFEEICKYLAKSHFFVFPSQEKKEGHSNSLTEAMAYGVVPIASTAGFSRSIINDADLIVEEINANDYANKIEHIINSGKWQIISDTMFSRVKEYYTESKVKKTLIEAINLLIEN